MTEQIPSVSRMVHYVSFGTPGGEYPSVCRAAVITQVGGWVTIDEEHFKVDGGDEQRILTQKWVGDVCALNVLNPTGEFFNECQHDEDTKKPGTWHWVERV